MESRDLLEGAADVVVCDGFTGNMALKALEGTIRTLLDALREEIGDDAREGGGLMIRPAARRLRRRLDPDTYGGAYLLGLQGLAVIAHGNSSRTAIANAIQLAARGVEHDVVERSARLAAETSGSDVVNVAARVVASAVRLRPRTGEVRSEMAARARRSTSGSRTCSSSSSVSTRIEITEEASFQEDLDADSLDLVELIMELEDQFGVKISDEDAQGSRPSARPSTTSLAPVARGRAGRGRSSSRSIDALPRSASSASSRTPRGPRTRASRTSGSSSSATACSSSRSPRSSTSGSPTTRRGSCRRSGRTSVSGRAAPSSAAASDLGQRLRERGEA